MADGIDTLSKVSGLSRATIGEIAAKVRQNASNLNSCAEPHNFVPVGKRPFMDRERCTKCGGEVDHHGAYWYKRGLLFGGSKT